MNVNKETCIHYPVCWHYSGDGLIIPCEKDCPDYRSNVIHPDYSRTAVSKLLTDIEYWRNNNECSCKIVGYIKSQLQDLVKRLS